MVHKNLRTLLSYVVGVTFVCLMIEFSKRGKGSTLDPSLYVVYTASSGDLATKPTPGKGQEQGQEVIPRRNRGRPGEQETAENSIPSLVKGMPDMASQKSKMEQFKQWKLSMKISPDEIGLFKKWKKSQGLGKNKERKGKDVEEEEDNMIEDDEEEEEKEDEEEEEEEAEEKETKASNKKKLDIKNGKDEEDKSGGGYDTEDDEEEGDEYPTGVSEYDPPDSQHSCTAVTMTDRLLQRANDASAACERLEDELGDQRRLYSRLRWAVPERLLYCPVFKAASTSWLVNYLKLSNSTTNPKSGNLHTKITNLFPAPATFKLRKRIFEESTKFIVVRHPFERFVSAYRDKLAGFSRNPHYLAMRKHIIDKYRKSKKDTSAIPTFRESFDFVLAELEKMEATGGKGKILIDGHFMPYSRRCLPCAMNYDVIIKFETLEEDSKYLIEQCGLDDRLKILHENPAPTGDRTEQGFKNKSKKVKKGKEKPKKSNSDAEATLDYFRAIPTSKIKKLYQHYRHDFEIFGYSAEEYLELE